MTSSNLTRTDRTNWRGKLMSCALMAITLGLTACAALKPAAPSSAQLYQPAYLTLDKGWKVKAVEGIYTPQQKETWVAVWKYREIEDENVKLIEALRAGQHSSQVDK
ncbi:MAG: hypothetical protein V1746_08050 [bacterium]